MLFDELNTPYHSCINGMESDDHQKDGHFVTKAINTLSQKEISEDHEESIKLSKSIFIFPTKTVGEHGNVYEGEIRSSVYGVRPCVIKFAELSEQNVREAEILTKLGSHTNVIAIIQSGTYCDVFDERVYIALDKCHNENLRQYLANRKEATIEFNLNQAIDFAKQIIVGVMYIHDSNVIHLDIKPSNILISQNLHLIKIADFGLSIVVKSPKSKIIHQRQFGTNGYRPIESFGNGEVSQRTDIFSLGTVLLHLLSNGNDVFGPDEHAFIHNVVNDITDTSGLLVSNPRTTEHLIKCMVSKERCRRPNIWEVSDHPCWSGKETECHLEYFTDDEVFDNAGDSESIEKGAMTSLFDREGTKQFLRMMREMGFNRKPAIIVFDGLSKHLHLFDHRRNSMAKMHRIPFFVSFGYVATCAVSLGEYIYFLVDESVYRFEYGDVTATWEELSSNNLDPDYDSIVASSDAIFVVGDLYETRASVYNYDPLLDEWEKMKDRPTTVFGSGLLCFNGFLYCFGGFNKSGDIVNKVERMNLSTTEWCQLTNMSEPRWKPSASEFHGRIYLLGGFNGHDELNSVEMYNPELDQWTNVKPMLEKRSRFRSFWIEGNLFAFGGDGIARNSIEKFDPVRDEWTIVGRFPEMNFMHAVLVSMST